MATDLLLVCVVLASDGSLEDSETFFVTISSADTAVELGNDETEVTIAAGDGEAGPCM